MPTYLIFPEKPSTDRSDNTKTLTTSYSDWLAGIKDPANFPKRGTLGKSMDFDPDRVPGSDTFLH